MTFIIGLDLDGVCYHFERTARYMLRRHIEDQARVVPSELFQPSRDWDWIQDNCSRADWEWLWSDGVREGLFRYGHVVGGAIEGVQALNKIGDVVAITARPKQAVHDTLVWLATMFDKAPLSGLVIQSHGQVKSQVSTPAPHVFIDDAGHNMNDILENTAAYAVLFDQPWNSTYSIPSEAYARRFTRARSWRHVIEIVQRVGRATC